MTQNSSQVRSGRTTRQTSHHSSRVNSLRIVFIGHHYPAINDLELFFQLLDRHGANRAKHLLRLLDGHGAAMKIEPVGVRVVNLVDVAPFGSTTILQPED